MKFEIYKDTLGDWRWRLLSRNGRIVADSGEGYKSRATMIKTMRSIFSDPLLVTMDAEAYVTSKGHQWTK